MKLMDADALYGMIKQHEYILSDRCNSTDYGMFTIGIKQVIDESPAIDAVPVVRCKDCICRAENKEKGYKYCMYAGWLIKDDDFCSHAERLDEEVQE